MREGGLAVRVLSACLMEAPAEAAAPREAGQAAGAAEEEGGLAHVASKPAA